MAEKAKEQKGQLPVSQALRPLCSLLRDLGQHHHRSVSLILDVSEFQLVSAPGNQQTLVRTDGKCKKDHYNDGNKMLIMLHTT